MQEGSKIKERIKSSNIGNILRKGKHRLERYKSRILPKGADALRLAYAGYYTNCNVDDTMILYEAYAGRGMLCSPYAIFKMFQKRSDFNSYKHVWVVEKSEQKIDLMKQYTQPNVRFVIRDSEEYCKCLCTAKFLINNLSFPNYFTKKDDQIYINTWHGIPLKTLGFDVPGGRITGLNTIRNFLSVDVFLSPNHFMTECFQHAFLLDGVYEGYIMESGMPRNDNLFHTDRKKVIQNLRRCGVEIDEAKKLILYAPTWKGKQYSNPDTSTELYFRLMEKVEKNVDTNEYQILVKPHQIVYKHIVEKGEKITNKFIPATIDTNEILSIVDILISDYSSIYFDYLASRKPILFYIPDLQDYQEQRGLYFGLDKLPGPITQNLDELGGLLKNLPAALAPYKEKYERERKWACGNDDGKVCERVIEKIIVQQDFSGLITCDHKSKKKILLYSGDLQPGKTRSDLENWINSLNYDKYDVTLIVPHTATENVLDWIRSVDSRVRVLRRTGKIAVTANNYKNADILEKELISEKEYKQDKKAELIELCKIEMRRTVGQIHFDYVMDFSGCSVYYQNLFSVLQGAEIVSMEQLQAMLK